MSVADPFKGQSIMMTAETASGEILVSKMQNVPSVTTLITECAECQEEFEKPIIIIELDANFDPEIELDEVEIERQKKHVICNDCKEVLAENS